MHDVSVVELTISGEKFVIEVSGITIAEMMNDYDRRHSEQKM